MFLWIHVCASCRLRCDRCGCMTPVVWMSFPTVPLPLFSNEMKFFMDQFRGGRRYRAVRDPAGLHMFKWVAIVACSTCSVLTAVRSIANTHTSCTTMELMGSLVLLATVVCLALLPSTFPV